VSQVPPQADPGSGGAPTSNLRSSRFQFAADVLAQLGIPDNGVNDAVLIAWMAAESSGPESGQFNPLNISHDPPGAPKPSSIGIPGAPYVRNYATWNDGVTATAQALRESNYRGILAALGTANAQAISAAIVQSPWAGGHYGGNPMHIYDLWKSTDTAGVNIAGVPAGKAVPGGGGAPVYGGDPGAVQPGTHSPVDAIGGALNALGTMAGVVTHLGAKLADPHFWARLILGAMAVVAIAYGAYLIADDIGPPAVRQLANRAKDVATLAAAA